MLGESHDVLHEFPEYRDRIDELRRTDSGFSSLMTEYDELDARIRQLEEKGSPVADETIEDLKKERIMLKDRIFNILKS